MSRSGNGQGGEAEYKERRKTLELQKKINNLTKEAENVEGYSEKESPRPL